MTVNSRMQPVAEEESVERGGSGWLQQCRGCLLCCQVGVAEEGVVSRLVTLSLAKID